MRILPGTAAMSEAGAPKVIGFFGDSGSGKTTLIERLIARFHARGLRVAAVKHAHHGFDVDRPGKDSYRFRAAGAAQVLLASERRWALLGETVAPAEGGDVLARQLARLDPCDLVLIEGFRGQAGVPFIHVRRRLAGGDGPAPAAAARDRVAGLIAVASDERLPEDQEKGIPVLDLNDIDAIAAFIAARLGVKTC